MGHFRNSKGGTQYALETLSFVQFILIDSLDACKIVPLLMILIYIGVFGIILKPDVFTLVLFKNALLLRQGVV